MKKVIIALLLNFALSSVVYAESYYFKECKLTEVLVADYLIDIDKNVIKVNLKAVDGTFQSFEDEIKIVEKNRIVSKKIKSGKSNDVYFVYYLDVKSKSVLKQNYKRESSGLGIFRPIGQKKQSFCSNIKADWNVSKIKVEDSNKEQEKILKCKGDSHVKWTNCVGKYSSKQGITYIGKFKDGKIIDGSTIYPGGSKYSGKFKNNKPHGEGTFTFSDGSKYYGEWKDGKGDGNGTKIWTDGRKYSGKFKNDEPHGQGTFTYNDGSKYVGNWKDGKRHGEGTLTYSDGRVYIGEFVNGQEHGIGTCFADDGSKIDCKKDISASGINKKNISIDNKKWINLSDFESTSGKAKKAIDKLENDFNDEADKLCVENKNYKILKKKIIITEITESLIKVGIRGVVECR